MQIPKRKLDFMKQLKLRHILQKQSVRFNLRKLAEFPRSKRFVKFKAAD